MSSNKLLIAAAAESANELRSRLHVLETWFAGRTDSDAQASTEAIDDALTWITVLELAIADITEEDTEKPNL